MEIATSSPQKGRRGPGIPIFADRLRQLRLDRGMSLADVAGGDVSRAFVSQLEQGRVRPSWPVLAGIATRLGKPISYFTNPEEMIAAEQQDLASELRALARRLERWVTIQELSKPSATVIRMVVQNQRYAAEIVAAVERGA